MLHGLGCKEQNDGRQEQQDVQLQQKCLFLLCLTIQSPVVTICTTKFAIQKLHVLPTHCIYVFCVDLRKKQRLFPYTTLTDWFL